MISSLSPSEPVDMPKPYEPGVHHAEATTEEMPAVVGPSIADRPARSAPAAAG